MNDLEALQDEQEFYADEEEVYKLKHQIKVRKITAGIFFLLSAICLAARLIAL